MARPDGAAAEQRLRESGAVSWSQGRREGSRRLHIAGWVLAVAVPFALTGALRLGSHPPPLPVSLMLYLAAAVAIGLAGDAAAAAACAVLSFLLVNYFFIPPYGTLAISEPSNIVALVVYVVVSVVVSVIVARNRTRTDEALAAQQLATSLVGLSQDLLESPTQVPLLLERATSMLQADGAALLEVHDGEAHVLDATSGYGTSAVDVQAAPIGPRHQLLVAGAPTDPLVPGLMRVFAAHASAILVRQQLLEEQRSAQALARDNRARTALLSAVSHDLRTPLAGIKAAITSLRSDEVEFTPADEQELLAEIDAGADRLNRLITNLLDMSRIAAGATTVHPERIDVAEVVDAVVVALSDPARVRVECVSASAIADPGLLDRVLANLLENALHHTSTTIEVHTQRAQDRVRVLVVDHGRGISPAQREGMFRPFQRYGDTTTVDGVGLGLAVARGLTQAMGGELTAHETRGGGLTMVVALQVPGANASANPGVPTHCEHLVPTGAR